MSTQRGPRVGDVVEVRWRDSCRVALGWATSTEYRRALRDERVPSERSAGYFVGRDKHSVMVALSVAPKKGHLADAMVIPRAAISEITVLGRAGRRVRKALA